MKGRLAMLDAEIPELLAVGESDSAECGHERLEVQTAVVKFWPLEPRLRLWVCSDCWQIRDEVAA